MKSVEDIVLDLIDGSIEDFKNLIQEIKDSQEGERFTEESLFSLLREALIQEGYPSNQANPLLINTLRDLCFDITLESQRIKLPHKCKFKELSDKEKKDNWLSVSAQCTKCNTCYGWRCLKSPDGVCHYFTNPKGKKVELINGKDTKLFKTQDYDPEYESDDFCLYCGLPDDRK